MTRENITVVTSFSAEGLALYGQEFLDTFHRYWPGEVRLLVYAEGCQPTVWRGNTRVLDLFTEIPACESFVRRHADNVAANGRHPVSGWKKAALSVGYNFRMDAVRFSRKPFAVQAAARQVREGVLLWVDADVSTRTVIPISFLRGLFPPGYDYCYLGRRRNHSECGFLGYRLPNCLPLIDALVRLYETDALFALDEWHDSYLFDVVRGKGDCAALRGLDLSREPRDGDVFNRSILGSVMEHNKGDKKIAAARVRAGVRL